MPHYIDTTTNTIYVLDSSEHINFILDGCVEITAEEAATIHAETTATANAAYLASLTYQELRASEYPDFRLYLDGVVKNDQQQIQDYIDACLAVKEKYPKT
jgi:hypothetical protein